MKKTTQLKTDLAKEYVYTFAVKQNYGIANELFSDNCIIYRNIGTSIGIEHTVHKIKELRYKLEPIKVLLFDELISDHCGLYKMKIRMKHIGKHYNIEATGKEIEFNVSSLFDLRQDKIQQAVFSVDVESIIQQIGGNSQDAVVESPIMVTSFGVLFDAACQTLESQNIRITARQFAHLCLWHAGKSATGAGKVLDISPRTVNYYHERLKIIFKCYSKPQLIEYIDCQNLTHILTKASSLLITNKPKDNKEMFSLLDNFGVLES